MGLAGIPPDLREKAASPLCAKHFSPTKFWALHIGGYMGKRYFVVQTHPGQEEIAKINLINQGFDIFLPSFVEERVANKRFPWRGGSVVIPLFATYLFINLDLKDQRWRSVNGTRGVVRILGAVEEPTPVPVGFCEQLQGLCETGKFDKRIIFGPKVSAGQKARVIGGSFGGLIGRVLEARATRVKLVLNAFGGAVEVSFGSDAVEALA